MRMGRWLKQIQAQRLNVAPAEPSEPGNAGFEGTVQANDLNIGHLRQDFFVAAEVFAGDGAKFISNGEVGKINTARDEDWKPFTKQQCEQLLKKYPNDLELWNRFWAYMAEQSNNGCPFDFVKHSAEILEEVWQDAKKT